MHEEGEQPEVRNAAGNATPAATQCGTGPQSRMYAESQSPPPPPPVRYENGGRLSSDLGAQKRGMQHKTTGNT